MTEKTPPEKAIRSAWLAGWRNGFLLGIFFVVVGMGLLTKCSHG